MCYVLYPSHRNAPKIGSASASPSTHLSMALLYTSCMFSLAAIIHVLKLPDWKWNFTVVCLDRYICFTGYSIFHRLLHLAVQIFSTLLSMPCVVEATKLSRVRLENNATYITCQTEGEGQLTQFFCCGSNLVGVGNSSEGSSSYTCICIYAFYANLTSVSHFWQVLCLGCACSVTEV